MQATPVLLPGKKRKSRSKINMERGWYQWGHMHLIHNL